MTIRFHFQTGQPSDKGHYEVEKYSVDCTFFMITFFCLTKIRGETVNSKIFVIKDVPWSTITVVYTLHKAKIKSNEDTINILVNNDDQTMMSVG